MTRKTCLLLVIAWMAATVPNALAGTENVIFHFNDINGLNPTGALVADANGNLYGATFSGGSSKCNSSPCNGLVFELSPAAGGGWTQTVIFNFSGGANGSNPEGTLILDGKGNLYGTTPLGDTQSSVVFELSPQANGPWAETVIHTFGGTGDGADPQGAITFDAQGNLYGATIVGGANNSGVVYELTPQASGPWTETILHSFGGTGDMGVPFGGVALDSHGNVFGASSNGGTNNIGAIYELTPNGSGPWTETIIHSFSDADGIVPLTPVTFDSSGNLYGSTLNEGGAYTYGGTIWRLAPGSGSAWTFTVLHAFSQSDGYDASGVALDSAGNVYGTTKYGGSGCYQAGYGGCGIVFELTLQANGTYKEVKLHAFESAMDGSQPQAGVVILNGNVYGMTEYGGNRNGDGTVFKVQP